MDINIREDMMLSEMTTADAPAQSVPGTIQRQPSRWVPEFDFNTIIEWRCGNCHKIIYYGCWKATYCPHCGAPIFNFPRRKLDAPQHRDMTFSELEKMKYAGPDNRSRLVGRRVSGKASGLYSHRPGPKDRGKSGRI